MFHIDLPLEKECKFFHLAEFYLFVFCRNRTFDRIGKYLHLPFDIHILYCLDGFSNHQSIWCLKQQNNEIDPHTYLLLCTGNIIGLSLSDIVWPDQNSGTRKSCLCSESCSPACVPLCSPVSDWVCCVYVLSISQYLRQEVWLGLSLGQGLHSSVVQQLITLFCCSQWLLYASR